MLDHATVEDLPPLVPLVLLVLLNVPLDPRRTLWPKDLRSPQTLAVQPLDPWPAHKFRSREASDEVAVRRREVKNLNPRLNN